MVQTAGKNGLIFIGPPYTLSDRLIARKVQASFSGGISGRVHQALAEGADASIRYPDQEKKGRPPKEPKEDPPSQT